MTKFSAGQVQLIRFENRNGTCKADFLGEKSDYF